MLRASLAAGVLRGRLAAGMLRASLAAGILALAVAASGCGGHHPPAPVHAAPLPPPPSGRITPAFGITEGNAHLIAPGALDPAPRGFAWARAALWSLHPRYLRVDVDWSKLQPRLDRPPRLDAPQDGCTRGRPPCAPYHGLRDVFAAIVARRRAGSAVEPVLNFYGAPAWAVGASGSCQPPATPPAARAVGPQALAEYRALIADVLALARGVGLEVRYLSPWNEPNNARFLSPQREVCDPGAAPTLAAGVYASLARTMRAVLRSDSQPHALVLGELAGASGSGRFSSTIGDFVSALPTDVVCSARVWSVHAYARHSRAAPDQVAILERALDRRARCARGASIWVTETGAGAPQQGGPPQSTLLEQRAACRALGAMLDRWDRDPRVKAAFQYSFRQDPVFPVGLVGPALKRPFWTYSLWRVWNGPANGATDPRLWAGCA
jgi:hypothetical protein